MPVEHGQVGVVALIVYVVMSGVGSSSCLLVDIPKVNDEGVVQKHGSKHVQAPCTRLDTKIQNIAENQLKSCSLRIYCTQQMCWRR